jgi:hypothetical protein
MSDAAGRIQITHKSVQGKPVFFSLGSEEYKDAFHGKLNYVHYTYNFPEALKLYADHSDRAV